MNLPPHRWQLVKTLHKQNAQCSGTQKTVSKQTRTRVFATSIFAIFIDLIITQEDLIK